jgi:tetratricopeptide (TPR) repeat protein
VVTDEPGKGESGMIDPVVMYDNLMNKFAWGNASDPSVYLDENNRRMFSNFRRLFSSLGKALILKGDNEKAIAVVHRCLEIIPAQKIPNDFFSIGLAEVLISAGRKEEGEKLLKTIVDYSKNYLDYAISIRPEERYGLEYPTGINMQGLLDIYDMTGKLKLDSLGNDMGPIINNYYTRLYSAK